MKRLLRLYPPAWQRRYRGELEAYLTAERPRIRTVLDLIAGAIDAWANPHLFADNQRTGGEPMIESARRRSAEIAAADAKRSGAWMLGLSFMFASFGVLLDKTFGESLFIDAWLYASFFIALTISSRYSFLKPYSRLASNSMIALMAIAWYGFFLGTVFLAELI